MPGRRAERNATYEAHDTETGSSISKARSYEEIGQYWDAHDLPDAVAHGKPADFTVDILRRQFLVAIEPALFAKVRRRAAKQGLSAERLVGAREVRPRSLKRQLEFRPEGAAIR